MRGVAIHTEPRLGVLRMAVTGAVVGAVLYMACWIGAVVAPGLATHAFIGLFTVAPLESPAALWVGSWWALVFGTASGALIAVVYNLLAPLSRR